MNPFEDKAFYDKFTDETMSANTGCTRNVFYYLVDLTKHTKDSPFKNVYCNVFYNSTMYRKSLFNVLYWIKAYPLHRSFEMMNLQKTVCTSYLVDKMADQAEWLADKIGLVHTAFMERFNTTNIPPHAFSYMTTGSFF
jgi:hypothetical protein